MCRLTQELLEIITTGVVITVRGVDAPRGFKVPPGRSRGFGVLAVATAGAAAVYVRLQQAHVGDCDSAGSDARTRDPQYPSHLPSTAVAFAATDAAATAAGAYARIVLMQQYHYGRATAVLT